MRFLEVTSFPGKYMYWYYRLHPGLAQAPYAEQKAAFTADGVNAGLHLAEDMRALGYTAETVIANNLNLQAAWAAENNFPPPSDYADLVIEQIDRFEPDILYLINCPFFGGRFLSRLPKRSRLVFGWHYAPLFADTDWTGYDLILSPLRSCRAAATACGAAASDYAFAGFRAGPDPLPEHEARRVDVAFCGTWSPEYSRRNAFLETLAREALSADERELSRVLCLNALNHEELSPGVAALNRGAVWGKRMYALLAASRLVVNAVADYAQGEAPNLRHMEASGLGALLLAENHPSLRAFFQEDELATFASAGEMLEKIRHYLQNDAERQAVAERGRARCLRDFSTAVRARAMDRRIERALRPQSFDAAARENLVREAKQFTTAGDQGLVQAACAGLDKDLTAAMWESFCRGDAAEVTALAEMREKLTADSFEHAFCGWLARAGQGDMPAALALLRQELENFPENDRARGIYADLLAAYPA